MRVSHPVKKLTPRFRNRTKTIKTESLEHISTEELTLKLFFLFPCGMLMGKPGASPCHPPKVWHEKKKREREGGSKGKFKLAAFGEILDFISYWIGANCLCPSLDLRVLKS